MSNPENPSRLEELAALHALDLLETQAMRELLDAAGQDREVDALLRDYEETAALLAYEAPQILPPPALRGRILRELPGRAASAKIVSFSAWVPYAIAACLMALGISQALQIVALKSQVVAFQSRLIATGNDVFRLRQSNALIGLRLATLEAKDVAYSASKIMVAWDPYQHRGVVSMQNLPTPPAGHDYQLWVLDPGAEAPISAGLITDSRSFEVKPVSTSTPGFAVSLEPSGGRPEPTGPILFAVAPGS
jgi:anti-sigma-K factor RskA